jgi:hypothetical protein
MDPIVCGVDRLQNAGVVNIENEVTAAIDAVMDCVEVSAVVDLSTASVEHQVNDGQCLFAGDAGYVCVDYCLKCCKGELGK